MKNEVNQCPKCKVYIFGTYCAICRKEISELWPKQMPDILKDMFGGNNGH